MGSGKEREDAFASTRLDGPTPNEAPTVELPIVDPRRYAVLDEIGRGGLGRVSRARDARLGRIVALKQPISASESPLGFLHEALLTARLQHPAIVPVYDAGYWPDGSPFYAMKLVRGRTLAELVARAASLEDRLAWLPSVIAVADAIAYAHSERVVHLDLKPANILVGDYGETVVVDWGIGRVLGGVADGDGQGSGVAGTPAYMSPEQARGDPLDERADVYALGAILHTLLTGGAPYDGTTEEILAQVKAGPPPALRRRAPRTPADLVTIVEKALAREPRDRYATAETLAADLRRFQSGQLVLAHTYSAGARLERWVRRRRAPLAVAGLLLAVLAVVGALSLARIVRAERAEAARRRELTLLHARAVLDADPTEAVAWLKTMPVAVEAGKVRLLAAAAKERGLATTVWRGHEAQILGVAVTPDGRTAVSVGTGGEVRVWDVASGTSRALVGHTQNVIAVALSEDGRRAMTGSLDHTARLWETDGRLLYTFSFETIASAVAIRADGAVAAAGAVDGTLELRGADGRTRRLAERGKAVTALAFDRAGRLASGARDGGVRVWQDDAPVVEITTGGGEVGQIDFSPDGARLATPCGAGMCIFDPRTGAKLDGAAAPDPVERVVFIAGGEGVAAGTHGGDVLAWRPGAGEPRLLGHHGFGPVQALALSGDGRLLVSGGLDGVVAIHDLADGTARSLYGQGGETTGVAWAGADRLITVGTDGTFRVWPRRGAGRVLPGQARHVNFLSFSPDGQRVATAVAAGVVRVYPVEAGGDPSGAADVTVPEGRVVVGALFAPGGRELVLVAGRELWIGSAAGGPARLLGEAPSPLTTVVYARDHLVTGDGGGALRLWQPGGEARVLAGHAGPVADLVVSADGRTLASAGLDGTARVWDATSGEGRVLLDTGKAITAVSLSPRGDELACAGVDGSVRVVPLAGGAGGAIIAHHAGSARHVWFSPDGGRVVSAGTDGDLVLWERRGGRLRTLRGHTQRVTDAAFSHDGKRLVSAGQDQTLRMWDLDSGEQVVLTTLAKRDHAVAISPDGRTIAAVDEDGTLHLVPDDAPAGARELAAWLDGLTTATVQRAAGTTQLVSP